MPGFGNRNATQRPVADRRGAGQQSRGRLTIIARASAGPTSEQLVRIARDSLEADKAEDITIVDLAGKTSFADSMIIASGRSHRHVAAIAEHLVEKLKDAHARVAVEGRTQADWVLIDAGDVIVHIFRPEVRSFYNLEKMWAVPLPEQVAG